VEVDHRLFRGFKIKALLRILSHTVCWDFKGLNFGFDFLPSLLLIVIDSITMSFKIRFVGFSARILTSFYFIYSYKFYQRINTLFSYSCFLDIHFKFKYSNDKTK
jgi:hypothetical protein